MSFFSNLSLKWKAMGSVTITAVLAVIATNIISVNREIDHFNNAIQTDAVALARVLAGSNAGALEFDDSVSSFASLESLKSVGRVKAAVVYNYRGNPFAWYVAGKIRGQSLPAGLPTQVGREGVVVEEDLELFEPVVSLSGEPMGTVFLRVDLSELEAVVSKAIWEAFATAVVIILISVGVAYAIQASIVGPVNRAVEALRDIAEGEGDLTRRLPVNSQDEMGQLATWFNTFISRVQNIITDVSNTSSELHAASDQLSSTAKETEQGVINQQSEIQQVVSAVREMAAVVEDVAGNVAETAASADSADKEALSGREVVGRTVNQINALAREINTASEVISRLQQETDNIGSVLDVIRGIAEQTNLLALNAAIEAARAGEQGRGFAVVADEVRTLASRTQASTQEIQEMIERLQGGALEAVQMMESGTTQASESVKQAEAANHSLEEIAGGVSRIRDKTNQIASASEEQSAATREMERNMENIAEVAHQTADSAVAIAGRSSELVDIAGKMEAIVKRFKL